MALTSLCHTHEWRVDESLCSRYILQSSNHAHWQYNGLIPWAAIQVCKVAFTNYVDKILAFFDHLPTLVDIGEEIPSLLKGKICTSLTFPLPPTYLLTSSCQRSLWMSPNSGLESLQHSSLLTKLWWKNGETPLRHVVCGCVLTL